MKQSLDTHLYFAQVMANLLDNSFSVAGFRFGLDPIIGLVPVLGDIIPFLLSFHVIWLAKQYNLPATKIRRMFFNSLTEFVVGSIPVVGDWLDFLFRSNIRSLKILQQHLQQTS